jgi:Fe-S oxidoreductase
MAMTFSLWEQILLGALCVVSLALAFRELAPKIRHILAGRSDRVRTDRFGARLWRVIKEVLFQSRVISGRPVVGILHAIVFLGFLTFAFETTDHFLEAVGVPFLVPLLGPALPLFKWLLALVAIAVSVAITALAFRRFVMVKISPGPKSYSSGVVALMILLLMLTYLNDVAGHIINERVNWWVHALLILAFPPLILRSKHFHILMAPVDIFFRTFGLGEYVPLDLDEESLMESEEEIPLGLETIGDTPWKMRMDFLTCVECRRCTDNCPANTCDQELDPRAFILAGRYALGQEEAPVVGTVISDTALGQCTSCGACENICPVGIEHLQVLIGAKQAQALSIGKGMVAVDYLQMIERYGNPFSARAEVRSKLVEELDVPLFEKGKTEVLLWLGCVWAYNPDARVSLEAMIEVMNRSGVSYGVLEEEACCGHHSRRQGEEMQFQMLAQENIESLLESGARKILAPCPHCLHTLAREYPTLNEDFSVEVEHHAEFFLSLIEDGKLQLDPHRNGGGKRLTYHDPCYLSRYEKVLSAPRDVISRAGYSLTELPRQRERSFCCGGGSAGFVRTHEEERRVDQERKSEVAESGADILVTACPECKMMLDATVSETLDLAELVARALQ